jgi:glucose/arabinose dehydrogenase
MTKRHLAILLGALVLVPALVALVLVSKFKVGDLKPALSPLSGDIGKEIARNNALAPGENATDFPLKLPDGFKIEVLAKIPGARVVVQDHHGNLWVSSPSAGKVYRISLEGDAPEVSAAFSGLDRPHGLAVDDDALFIAEETRVSRVTNMHAGGKPEKIADLPKAGLHFTRTLGIGPDRRLYVSIGSTCNACREKDPRYAAMYSMRQDGSDFRQFAKGLRNTVFFAWNPADGNLWGADMGRDLLGDDLPPDELNIVRDGNEYGWPVCYGKNVPDRSFDRNADCSGKTASHIDLPAHSAPLGIAFVPEEGWPPDYANDLIVAFHGSWNRSTPTGYKLARILLDDDGKYLGMEDFVSGWLAKDGGALGRPVGVLALPGGLMYVTDDKAGLVYKITYAASGR